MKHLKLFEGFTPDDYYKQIDNISEEFDKTVDMSDKTIKKISDFNWQKGKKFEVIVEWSRNNVGVSDFRYIRIKGIKGLSDQIGIEKFGISIVERDDEWFMVRMPLGIWWECDQITGLQELLKNKKAIV